MIYRVEPEAPQPMRGRAWTVGMIRNGTINLCTVCGEEPTHLSSFTIDPLRTAPASTTYRRDDCTRSSDRDEYRCEEHYRTPALRGYSWGASRKLSPIPERYCCRPGCRTEAAFDIYGESNHPDDSTMGCADHVGWLLGTPDWLGGDDNGVWTVVALGDTP